MRKMWKAAAWVVSLGSVALIGMAASATAQLTDSEVRDLADEKGFVPLFDGKTLDGWTKKGGPATYRLEDGCIVGECQPGPTNTFLCTEREFGDFILRLDFKVEVPGNSGVQFRSHAWPAGDEERVCGYQCEIDPSSKNDTGRIYDEGRRGFQHGRTWLDDTPNRDPESLSAAQESYKPGDWNTMEIQCMGPSIRTWINGIPVVDMFDYFDMSGFFGLQVHAGDQGKILWKNIRIREFGTSQWHPFFVETKDGMQLVASRAVLPECWEFTTKEGEGTFLKATHTADEPRDGLIVSDGAYDDFAARVTYRMFGGNSALYFRAGEVPTPWLLKGYQNEIAGNGAEAGIWHTAGDKTPGRGWLGRDDELVNQILVAPDKGWNTVCTCACGLHITTFLNGQRIVDIDDPNGETIGKLGLQLHGSSVVEMWFKDFEVIPITPEMRRYIER